MDKQTVIETIIEIANNGQFAKEAVVLLHGELKDYGYNPNEIHVILQTAVKANEQSNKERYAKNIYAIINDKKNAWMHIKDQKHFQATLLITQNCEN